MTAAVEGSRPLAATYYVAPAQHLGLEPLSATARFSGDQLEVWAPTQAPIWRARRLQRRQVAARVTLYPMPVGDPAGRALEADAIPMAVELARELQAAGPAHPVASGSQNHDRVAPAALARMTALPGRRRNHRGWKMRVATSDGLGSALGAARRSEDAARSAGPRSTARFRPMPFPTVRIEARPRDAAVRSRLHARLAAARDRLLHRKLHRRARPRRGPRAAGVPDGDARRQSAARALPPGGGARRLGRRRARQHAWARRLLGLRIAHRPAGERDASAPTSASRSHRLVAAVDCGRIVNPRPGPRSRSRAG